MDDDLLNAPTIAPRDSECGDNPATLVHSLPEIAGYDVIRELGAGGMGRVYLCRHQALDRLVAVKTMHSSDQELANILLTEARIASKLNHPGIVPIYEANVSGNIWYFAMGLVEGEDLSRRISRETYSPNDLIDLAKQVCDALEHAHGYNVLHLDIKPANILLDPAGDPKLADFGLAAFYAARKKDGVFGTPQFMPPEQALGDKDTFSPASDIYSLGAVMYSAIAGRPPIISPDPQDLLLKIVSQSPLTFRSQGIQVPAVLEAIILKCLAKSPTDRYTSAQELKADLVAFERNEPTIAKPLNIFSQAIYFVQRHLLAASVSGSIVIILLLLTTWLAIRSSAQSMEVMDLKDETQRLREERLVYERRLRTTLSIEQQRGFDLAVASELAQTHRDHNDMELCLVYAARAYLLASEQNMPIDSAIREILITYGTQVGQDLKTDADLLKLATDIVMRDDRHTAVQPRVEDISAVPSDNKTSTRSSDTNKPVKSNTRATQN